MRDGLCIGLDVGTSAVKAVVFDAERGVLGRGSEGYPFTAARPGWAEQDPELWWSAATAAICAALAAAEVTAADVEAVAVSGQGAALVLVDPDGRAVRPALIHLDQRATRHAEQLKASPLAEAVHRASGNRICAWNTLAKLAWVRAHEPKSLRAARGVTSAAGFVLNRLTGRLAQSTSDAGISDLFDLSARDWSAPVRLLADLPPAALPEVHPGTASLGPVRAADCPLGPATQVVAGGEDTSSAALAAGVLEIGDAYLSLGTAGVVGVAVGGGAVREPRLLTFPHVREGVDLLSGSMTSAGAAVAWWSDLTGADPATLLAEAEQVEPGSGGVGFLPYLAGELHPVDDPAARGVLSGLSLATGRAHVTRAILEGSASAVAHNLEVARSAGAEVQRLSATGRPTSSPAWMQAVADATGCPVDVVADDGASVGDAFLAAGESDDGVVALVRRHRRVVRTYLPDPARFEAAHRRRAQSARLYQATRESA